MTLTTVAIAAVAVVGYLAYTKLSGSSAHADPQTIRDKISAGATIVDVRTAAEFRAKSYPGAINIPVQELGSKLASLTKEKPVVLYCASGHRASLALKMLKQAGFIDVHNGGGLSQMPS